MHKIILNEMYFVNSIFVQVSADDLSESGPDLESVSGVRIRTRGSG